MTEHGIASFFLCQVLSPFQVMFSRRPMEDMRSLPSVSTVDPCRADRACGILAHGSLRCRSQTDCAKPVGTSRTGEGHGIGEDRTLICEGNDRVASSTIRSLRSQGR